MVIYSPQLDYRLLKEDLGFMDEGLYWGNIGIMEMKMETTIMRLYSVSGLDKGLY